MFATWKKKLWNAFCHIIMCAASVTVLVPLFVIVINSLKEKREANAMSIALPTVWCFENYGIVIENGKLIPSFFNSFQYAATATVLTVLLASLAAFIFSRNRTKLNRFLYFITIMGIAMPVNYAALMQVMQFFHLFNTRFGLCLLYTAMQIPFSVFLIHGAITSIPVELDEAAIIDGSSAAGLYFQIILPLLKPVIFTASILVFLNCWNDFIMPLYYMNTSTAWPMTLAVYNFFGRYESEWNLVCADILLTCLPVIIVYLLGQKYIISGMTAGAIKG